MSPIRFTRRQVLQIGGVSLLTSAITRSLHAQTTKPKQILYFTKSSGFEHSVVQRKNGALSHSETILVEMGKRHGFEVTPSKDGRIFEGDHLKYDGYVFYTSGDLTTVGQDQAPAMTAAGKQALLEAVSQGKGFVGIHAATDTFREASGAGKVDPFIAMLGGEFVSHGEQQKARMTVVNPAFPGLQELGGGFELLDEWYAQKHFAPDLHVLLVNETKGMKGDMYDRPPFPGTWARRHDKGLVFYTSLGHREDVWTNPLFEQIVVGGLQWATGQVQIETPANIDKVTPGAGTLGR
ncbi:MAG: ThuA domain-containing protein [Pirellulaceae bacterium]